MLINTRRMAFVQCFTAAALFFVTAWAQSHSVNPMWNTIDPHVRYTATFVGGFVLIGIAFAAFRAPKLLDLLILEVVVVITLVGGGACTFMALQTNDAFLLTIGACCTTLSRNIVEVLIGLAVAELRTKQIVPCIILAFLASAIGEFLLTFLPLETSQALYVILPLCSLLLITKKLRSVFNRLRKSAAPAEVSATQPKAFLPFNHRIYVVIFLFIFSYGYALGLGERAGGVPQELNLISLIPPFALLAIASFILKDRFDFDLLFYLSAFLVISGFMLIPYTDWLFEGFANTLLSVGSNCFRVLLWCILALVAHKSRQEGVIVFSWGRALFSLAIGAGTFVGRQHNILALSNEHAAQFVTVLIGLVFIGYILFAMRDFSFAQTIQSITPVQQNKISTGVEPVVDAQCEEIGERFSLTPREKEILVLIAKGRNAPYVEEKLVISRNTVKTHVKNIYRKLGVHSNQDLINLVESTPPAH